MTMSQVDEDQRQTANLIKIQLKQTEMFSESEHVQGKHQTSLLGKEGLFHSIKTTTNGCIPGHCLPQLYDLQCTKTSLWNKQEYTGGYISLDFLVLFILWFFKVKVSSLSCTWKHNGNQHSFAINEWHGYCTIFPLITLLHGSIRLSWWQPHDYGIKSPVMST